MVNRKGFMRIIEATIAVLLVLGALLLISFRGPPQAKADLTSVIPPLLDEVARRADLRYEIVTVYDTSKTYNEPANLQITKKIENYLKPYVTNPSLNFSVRICKIDDICFLEPYPVESAEDIYAAERIVTAVLNSSYVAPKKVKMFLWRLRT